MATDDLMTKALETVGDDGPLSVEVIHRLTDLAARRRPVGIARTCPTRIGPAPGS
jgi:hypothetical protein